MKDLLEETQRQIQEAPIRQPGPGEFVEECHWSKTGWAIWKTSLDHGSYCTCQSALPPEGP